MEEILHCPTPLGMYKTFVNNGRKNPNLNLVKRKDFSHQLRMDGKFSPTLRLVQSLHAHSGAVYGLAQRPDQKGGGFVNFDYQVLPSDLFGSFQWPFQGLSG